MNKKIFKYPINYISQIIFDKIKCNTNVLLNIYIYT